ncbi:hypothetical protein DL769_003170 [Monosporascus sp. CRB-8-3]|nr:hypothetical protein DL769_003170 [Monosporascus sp. CRB-8-3]
MTDQLRSNIIKENPIGKGLDAFRISFNSICEGAHISCTPDALEQLSQEDIHKLVLALLSTVQDLPAARLLPATTCRGTLRSDLLRLGLSLDSDDFDLELIKPLLEAALADDPDDALIWDQVYQAVTKSTPPPQPIASSTQQTPLLHNTSRFAESSSTASEGIGVEGGVGTSSFSVSLEEIEERAIMKYDEETKGWKIQVSEKRIRVVTRSGHEIGELGVFRDFRGTELVERLRLWDELVEEWWEAQEVWLLLPPKQSDDGRRTGTARRGQALSVDLDDVENWMKLYEGEFRWLHLVKAASAGTDVDPDFEKMLPIKLSLLTWKPSTAFETFSNFCAGNHLCEFCAESPMDQSLRSLGSRHKLCDSFSDLQKKAGACQAYNTILSAIEPFHDTVLGEIHGFAKRLSLSTEGQPTISQGIDIPTVFADLGSATFAGAKREIPILPEVKSDIDILFYREWLLVCQKDHDHPASPDAQLPTRVIDTGDSSDSDTVHLRLTGGRVRGVYIALSHRWQSDSPRTLTNNLDDRRNGIKLGDLPSSYQYAVHITRKLDVRFLWIDSLCILQDDKDDWDYESQKMDYIFASAYCVVAISPAGEGSGNFDEDVENGELSRRGWILQERALSRRTIHIVGRHAYWECGSAIWSKTSGEGRRPLNILGRTEFLKPGSPETPDDDRALFKHLFTLYTKCHLTRETDRPMAIEGLENRLGTFYRTSSAFGIFRKFLGESLLWLRARFRYADSLCSLTAPFRILSAGSFVPYGHGECLLRDADEAVVGWIRYDCGMENDPTCLGYIVVANGTTGWREFSGLDSDGELALGSFEYAVAVKLEEANMYRRIGVAVGGKKKSRSVHRFPAIPFSRFLPFVFADNFVGFHTPPKLGRTCLDIFSFDGGLTQGDDELVKIKDPSVRPVLWSWNHVQWRRRQPEMPGCTTKGNEGLTRSTTIAVARVFGGRKYGKK